MSEKLEFSAACAFVLYGLAVMTALFSIADPAVLLVGN